MAYGSCRILNEVHEHCLWNIPERTACRPWASSFKMVHFLSLKPAVPKRNVIKCFPVLRMVLPSSEILETPFEV